MTHEGCFLMCQASERVLRLTPLVTLMSAYAIVFFLSLWSEQICVCCRATIVEKKLFLFWKGDSQLWVDWRCYKCCPSAVQHRKTYAGLCTGALWCRGWVQTGVLSRRGLVLQQGKVVALYWPHLLILIKLNMSTTLWRLRDEQLIGTVRC